MPEILRLPSAVTHAFLVAVQQDGDIFVLAVLGLCHLQPLRYLIVAVEEDTLRQLGADPTVFCGSHRLAERLS